MTKYVTKNNIEHTAAQNFTTRNTRHPQVREHRLRIHQLRRPPHEEIWQKSYQTETTPREVGVCVCVCLYVCGTPLYMRFVQQVPSTRQERPIDSIAMERMLSLLNTIFWFYIFAGGRSVPASLLPTKTLSVHSDIKKYIYIYIYIYIYGDGTPFLHTCSVM